MFKSIIPCNHNIVGKGPSHTHAFLLVNKEAVFLNFDVFFQFCFDPVEIAKRFFRFF